MKIAFVSDAVFPYNKGGKEKRLSEITARLAEKNHDVHIYCMKWWNGSDIIKENNVNFHSVCKYIPLYTNKGRRSVLQGLYFGLNCLKLIKEDFDLIDVDHMPYFPLFSVKLGCLLKRKRMIATWHEVWGLEYWIKYLGWKGFFGYLVEKLSVLMPDKIISISETTTSKLKKYFNSKKKIYTIPNGIDLKEIQKIKPSEEKSDVIFTGRLLNHKNVDFLIKSIYLIKENYPNIKCLIIGEGPEKNKLEELTRNLKLEKNIKFLDFSKSEDVYSLMKSSKVFVLPSTREGFGIVVIEANACGIPVITIEHKDNASKNLIREGENGFISQLNEKEMADKILTSLSKNQDAKMQQSCVNSAIEFDWEKIVNKIEEIYLK